MTDTCSKCGHACHSGYCMEKFTDDEGRTRTCWCIDTYSQPHVEAVVENAPAAQTNDVETPEFEVPFNLWATVHSLVIAVHMLCALVALLSVGLIMTDSSWVSSSIGLVGSVGTIPVVLYSRRLL